MFEVRIHGRGGQGVVTAAEMLSIAGFTEGLWAQAFPSFGSERMGAPVTAFCRLDEREIRSREPVNTPDALIIQDPTLLHQVKVFDGLAKNGYVLINSKRSLAELGIAEFLAGLPAANVMAIPATELAIKHVGRPLPNAVLLAGFCAVTGRIRLASVEAAIRKKFPTAVAERNIAAAREAFAMVSEARGGQGTQQVTTAEGAKRHAEAV
ncbi:MAG: 2-oxoacid:acceptor oxidoreductase family protein [Phycisphaerae bacterium]|nr:2-oxoacid:acceptor oxidoreductase family protein [Phycisphaerae bacterium]